MNRKKTPVTDSVTFSSETQTRKCYHAQETQEFVDESGLICRRVDLIEEFVLDDLRHQTMNGFNGCLAAERKKK